MNLCVFLVFVCFLWPVLALDLAILKAGNLKNILAVSAEFGPRLPQKSLAITTELVKVSSFQFVLIVFTVATYWS